MTRSQKQAEFLRDVALLVLWVHQKGWYVTGGELHRPPETQKLLVEAGKSLRRAGQHQKRLAIDLFLFIDGKVTWEPEDYRPLGEFWQAIRPENVWGGSWEGFVDAVHFERSG